jgi:hypothetical protein
MEASGTTPPAEPAQPPPPPPETRTSGPGAQGAGWRLLAIVLALALAFAAAVMIIVAVDIGDTATCEDVRAGEALPNDEGECYDGSSTAKTIQVALAWPSGVLAGLAALVALYFAVTGLRSRLLLQLTGAAIVLGALSILIGAL